MYKKSFNRQDLKIVNEILTIFTVSTKGAS